MTFYGDRSSDFAFNFIFDKIYINKQEMENNAENDNVYINRYVLVSYDNYKEAYWNSSASVYVFDKSLTGASLKNLKESDYLNSNTCKIGDFFIAYREGKWGCCKVTNFKSNIASLEGLAIDPSDTRDEAISKFFYYNLKCDNSKESIEEIESALKNGGTLTNYHGTVWQKRFNKKEEYFKVAELNLSSSLISLQGGDWIKIGGKETLGSSAPQLTVQHDKGSFENPTEGKLSNVNIDKETVLAITDIGVNCGHIETITKTPFKLGLEWEKW